MIEFLLPIPHELLNNLTAEYSFHLDNLDSGIHAKISFDKNRYFFETPSGTVIGVLEIYSISSELTLIHVLGAFEYYGQFFDETPPGWEIDLIRRMSVKNLIDIINNEESALFKECSEILLKPDYSNLPCTLAIEFRRYITWLFMKLQNKNLLMEFNLDDYWSQEQSQITNYLTVSTTPQKNPLDEILNKRHRKIVEMYIKGVEYDDIVVALGTNLPLVKKTVTNIISQYRQKLGEKVIPYRKNSGPLFMKKQEYIRY